jgi:imidazolonepropionase-like amidohydrolase
MKNTLFVLILILFSFTVISAQTVAFTNVNVIPMDKERVLENQTVLVRDGFIVEIGKKVKIPAGAQVVDAKGKYLIPGLMDMHTHLLSDDDAYPDSIAEDELKVMLANGVTTIRLMIGTKEQLILREKSAKGEIIAPTIYAASPHLTGREQGNDFVVNTPDEAREAVRKSKAAGYDFIKITTFIKAEVYEAAIDEVAVGGRLRAPLKEIAPAGEAERLRGHQDGDVLLQHAGVIGVGVVAGEALREDTIAFDDRAHRLGHAGEVEPEVAREGAQRRQPRARR